MKGFRPASENHPVQEVLNGTRFLPGPCRLQIETPATIIRRASQTDIQPIYELYRVVARLNPGNLTQGEDEITIEYVSEAVFQGWQRGLVLVLEQENRVVGYLKAFTSPFRCLAHVLKDTTMMVHPEWQGKGYGSQLMEAYLDEIKSNMPHILRFELLPHQGNQRAIRFYERHGFYREGIARQKIRNPRGYFDSEVVLVWFNPNFSEEGLEKYHDFLSGLSH